MDNDAGGRLLAAGLLILAVALLLGFAAAPYTQIEGLRAQADESRALLSGLEKQIARQSALGGGAGSGPAGLMLSGSTTGIAGARLQKLINDLVSEAGGRASSFQILPAEEAGDMTRLGLSLAMSLDIDGLRDVLHRLETGAPLLFIDDIAIRAPTSALQEGGPDFLGPLDVTMTVSGFVLKDEAL